MFARKARAALFIIAVVLTLSAAGQGQNRPRDGRATAARPGQHRPLPRFSDYPAKSFFKGRPAPVVLDSRRARMFRTRLREDSRSGPNFAGHYTLVFWGCGTGCAQVAVVDARTGKIFWPPMEYSDIPDQPGDGQNQNFRLDSRLLVLTRSLYDGLGSYTAYYYLFDGKRFRLIRRAELTRPPEQD